MEDDVLKGLDVVINNLLPESVRKGLEKACNIVERKAKKNCPVNDGPLRASITHIIEGSTGYVGTNNEIAPYVHEGTGIYAKNGKGRKKVPWYFPVASASPKLRTKYHFKIVKMKDGTEFYVTSGQKPNPFLQKAVDENRDKILKCFEGLLK